MGPPVGENPTLPVGIVPKPVDIAALLIDSPSLA